MANGKNRNLPNWKQAGFGICVSTLTMLTMTAIWAAAVDRELIGLEWMNYLAAATLLISSFAGMLTQGSGLEKWPQGLILTGGFLLILLAINALGYDGDLRGWWASVLAILGGTGAALLLHRGGKRSSIRRRKRHNR